MIVRARHALLAHVEALPAAGQEIVVPTAADAIARNGALRLAAIDVPDDIRTVRVELDVPALSLARIEALARQFGLTPAALFVAAVDRWAIEEPVARPGTGEADGVMLPDFDNPLELNVETITVAERAQRPSAVDQGGVTEQVREVTADITAELARLLRTLDSCSEGIDLEEDISLPPKFVRDHWIRTLDTTVTRTPNR